MSFSARMTFWPRFYGARNDIGYRVKTKDIRTLGPGFYTEFRGGSSCASQFGWRYHICKILPGGVETRSKTPIRWIQRQAHRIQDTGSRIQDPRSWIVQDPGSWTQDHPGSWSQDPGSWSQDPGSWSQDLALFRTNSHYFVLIL